MQPEKDQVSDRKNQEEVMPIQVGRRFSRLANEGLPANGAGLRVHAGML